MVEDPVRALAWLVREVVGARQLKGVALVVVVEVARKRVLMHLDFWEEEEVAAGRWEVQRGRTIALWMNSVRIGGEYGLVVVEEEEQGVRFGPLEKEAVRQILGSPHAPL